MLPGSSSANQSDVRSVGAGERCQESGGEVVARWWRGVVLEKGDCHQIDKLQRRKVRCGGREMAETSQAGGQGQGRWRIERGGSGVTTLPLIARPETGLANTTPQRNHVLRLETHGRGTGVINTAIICTGHCLESLWR